MNASTDSDSGAACLVSLKFLGTRILTESLPCDNQPPHRGSDWSLPGRPVVVETANEAADAMDFDAGPYRTLSCITQNVDGFHAATGSTSVIDLHGDLNELVCTQCDFRERVEDQQPVVLPPRCPRCEAVLRPDVVLFGEMLPAAKTERLYHELRSGFDAVFSIGTSSAFHYVAWPIQLAKETGKLTVEINPGATEVSQLVDVRIPLRASAALDAIWTRYKNGG